MKKIIMLICSLILIFPFAGCRGQTNAISDESTSSEEEGFDDDVAIRIGKVMEIDGSVVTLQLGELTESEGSSNFKEGGTPPEKPSDGQNVQEEGGIPPEKPSDGQNGEREDGNPPEMPNGAEGTAGGATFTAGEETTTLDLVEAVITIESAEGAEEGDFSDISVGDILVVESGEDSDVLSVTIKNMSGGGPGQPGGFGGSGKVAQGSAANTIDSDGTYFDESYTSTGDDENALRVVGAEVTLDGITVNKGSGATSNTENGDFYGMNAALLATDGANVTITNATVDSSAQNGNGVFSYGEGTLVNISDSIVQTEADNSGGIQTTGNGTTHAANLQVTTSGSSSAAIRSDRGGGTVNVEGGSYTSNGYNSPAVYSTADITVKNAELTANNSEALVVEGKNSIALEYCTVTGNMSDTKGSSSDINVHNVMVYQSMSGDADVGTAVFSMKGGNLTSNNGDMIYVTNTHCILTLSDVEIVNRETDRYFLLVSGNDASHGWGKAGSNGAQVEFTADGQTFDGNIGVDSISSLTMALANGSVYTGAVNILENEQNGPVVDNNAVITVDQGSTWNLTGNCTLTSLTNNGTINFNGYTITLADGTVLEQ